MILLTFVYLYPLKLTFIPGGISTRIILGVIGVYFFLKNFNTSKSLIVSKKGFKLILSLVTLSIVTTISLIINNQRDLNFIIYPISVTFIISAAYALSRIAKELHFIFSFNNLLKLFITAVVIQNTLSVIMFILPEIRALLSSIVITDDLTTNKLSEITSFRLIGFGIEFFGAGVISALTLILIMYSICTKMQKSSRILGMVVVYVWVAITGICMARTTFLGILLSIIVFLTYSTPSLTINYKILRLLKSFVYLFIILTVIITMIPKTLFSQLEDLYKFGFELFINYQDSGEMSSESTNQLLEMYNILPVTFLTWVIGDGLWTDPSSGLYYMGSDVGYIRLVFYVGVIGTITYLWYQYNIVKVTCWNKSKYDRIPMMIFFIAGLILNFKGFTDITSYTIFFCWANNNQLQLS